MAHLSPLQTLPTELLYEIADYLDYVPYIALRFSCRDLKARLDGQYQGNTRNRSIRTSRIMMRDLLKIERWKLFYKKEQPIDDHEFFACCKCRRLRPASKFSTTDVTGRRKKGFSGIGIESFFRFCIDCGIASGQYHRGEVLRCGGVDGGKVFVCLVCRQLLPLSESVTQDCHFERCGPCWNRFETAWARYRDETIKRRPYQAHFKLQPEDSLAVVLEA